MALAAHTGVQAVRRCNSRMRLPFSQSLWMTGALSVQRACCRSENNQVLRLCLFYGGARNVLIESHETAAALHRKSK